MDVERIKKDVLNLLGLTSPMDKSRAESSLRDVIDEVLSWADWRFLYTEGTISVSSARIRYRVKSDVLYPEDDSVFCESLNKKIEVVNDAWLHTHWPDVSDIGELKYCIFYGRDVEFYYVGDLDSAVTITYGYRKVGSVTDLDFDPGFVQILKNGLIAAVAKPNDQSQQILAARAAKTYRMGLDRKANLHKRVFGGATKVVQSEQEQNFQSTRKDLRW